METFRIQEKTEGKTERHIGAKARKREFYGDDEKNEGETRAKEKVGENAKDLLFRNTRKAGRLIREPAEDPEKGAREKGEDLLSHDFKNPFSEPAPL